MVVPWIWFSIWIFWVIHVLVFLVFQVFSNAELTSPCENSEFDRLSFFIDFLYDFTLYVIDMHQNMLISLFHPPARIIWRVILKPCHIWKYKGTVEFRSCQCFLSSTGDFTISLERGKDNCILRSERPIGLERSKWREGQSHREGPADESRVDPGLIKS